VGIAIISIQAVFLRICRWKNSENRSIFARYDQKQSGCFLEHCVH